MEITIPSPHVIILTSTSYINALSQRCLPKPLSEYPAVHTPGHSKLMDFYEDALATRDVPRPAELVTRYRSIVGGILWPAPNTRPDVLLEAGVLARAFTFPTEDLFNSAVHLLVYLGQHDKYGIRFTGLSDNASILTSWSDSDWGVCRSVTGGCMQLAGGNIWAMSKRQDCTAGSSTHAEMIAASAVANETLWMRGLLDEVNVPQLEPTRIFMDNSGVLALSRDFASSSKTRHIERKHFAVRDSQSKGFINTIKVASADNWADLFTKVHTRQPFEKFIRSIMNIARVGLTISKPIDTALKLKRPVYGSRAAGRMWE